jgi:hypothetical protein
MNELDHEQLDVCVALADEVVERPPSPGSNATGLWRGLEAMRVQMVRRIAGAGAGTGTGTK